MPRFIISVRELYDHASGLHGVDTGFGALSQPIASQNIPMLVIAFAGVAPGQDQVTEGGGNESEPTRPEQLGDSTHHWQV